jgi:POT family proton-dependent oligopeptide transporter
VGAFFILWDESLLVLYMTSSTLGDDARGAGLGWTSQALALYGWYTMLVYIMSIPGGMIADRY